MIRYSQKEYNEVFSNAKTILKRPHYCFKIGLIEQKKKAIIVISKKNGNAVERNRNKRIVRAVFSALEFVASYKYTYIIIFAKKRFLLEYNQFYDDCIFLKERIEKF